MSDRRAVWALVVAAVVSRAAAADVVHLANGRKFEGVVAESVGDNVRIRFEFGEIALARRLVTRIERGGSALAEFEARRAGLAAHGEVGGEEWLALAQWARGQGLDHGAAQAALRAVELAPELAEAAALLAALGWVEDATSGQWLRYEEAMSRRGRVPYHGAWLAAEEATTLQAAAARGLEAAAAVEREARLTRALELLVLTAVVQATAPRAPVVQMPIYGVPVAFVPGPPPTHPPPDRATPGTPDVLDELLRRNPGSLLPVGDPRQVIRSRFSLAPRPQP